MDQNLVPMTALSVRQPWAWAIVSGHKVIENRSPGAIRSGGMKPGRIAIHASTGLSQKEYDWGAWRLAGHGVTAPRPEALVRRAIIGYVEVVDIIEHSDSEWFGGPWGLVLQDPVLIDPIPAVGELGYFTWERSGDFAPLKPWMLNWDRPSGDGETLSLFENLPPSFAETPRRPRRKGRD
jgi:hypothetical protein